MDLSSVQEVLSRLGLKGSCQIHAAPTVLQPDQRAHQVFAGFQSPDAFLPLFRQLYPSGALLTVFAGNGRSIHFLNEEPEWAEGALAVLPAMQTDHPGGFYGLVWIMDRLLGPGGCPWDQEQTHESLIKYLIEEAYELVEAIESKDEQAMKEELGDCLLQPIFHSQMKARDGEWSIEAPIKSIADKLIRRHPHVFGEVDVADAQEVLKNWDKIKTSEKGGEVKESVLAGVPGSLPALHRAMIVSTRAARCGFEWPDLDAVWLKVREEEKEFLEACDGGDREKMASELGDLLFTYVNVARWLELDAEEALRRMLGRFTKRFQAMESLSDLPLNELSSEAWDDLWVAAKRQCG